MFERFLFNKKKKKPKPVHPDVRTVQRIALGFLALALVFNMVKNHRLLPGKNVSQIENSIIDAAPQIPVKDIDYKKFIPNMARPITAEDVKPGTGNPAVCGQDVTVIYKTVNAGKTAAGMPNSDGPVTFRIGDHKALPMIERHVVGMAKGGERLIHSSLRLPQEKSAKMPQKTSVTVSLELLDAKPPLPDIETDPLQISDVKRGPYRPIICGNPVKVHVTIRDTNGNKLFSTHDKDNIPLEFTPGQSQVFLGLEQGVIDMPGGGERALIVPPAFQKTMRGNKPIMEFPFPADQTVLVDVEAIP